MASLRLPLLCSTLYRSCEISSPALRSARAAQRIRAYHPARRFQQDQIPQRYGTANEPLPHLRDAQNTAKSTNSQQSQDPKAQPKPGEKVRQDGEKDVNAEVKPTDAPADAKEPTTVDGRVSTISAPMTDPMLDSTTALPTQTQPTANRRAESNPIDTVLNSVPHPQSATQNAEDSHAEEHPDRSFDEHSPPIKAPHIEQPRYLHHFDTYGLVKRLKDSGWDEKQAITVMKAMRVILGDKTDLAKEALVSQSNLENEAYLFKAACAELRTEVMARRKSEQEKMRTERTQLQHEVDILSQRLGQETATLKDELKGMFDDRKMAVRNEQRDMESQIQQLNYRITVELQADAKSEVEGLRWIMTRRVIFTLGLVVLMIVGGLKLAANAIEANSKPAMVSGGTQTEFVESGRNEGAGGGSSSSGREVLVREGGGDGGGFVSLG